MSDLFTLAVHELNGRVFTLMSSSQITAIIIDDDKMGRDALKILLKNYLPEVRLLGVADSVDSGSLLIQDLKPQLVFLDVEMPEKDGFALFGQFPAPDFQVIFVTAFDHYAIRALRLSALDYLLKPVDLEELESAVGKAMENLAHPTSPVLLEQAIGLARQTALEKIAVPSANGFELLPLEEIVRLEADSNYTTIHTLANKKRVISKPLGHFENLLPPKNFFRVHASHVIHLKHIRRYVKGRGGHLEMLDGSVVPVSARRKSAFLKLFGMR